MHPLVHLGQARLQVVLHDGDGQGGLAPPLPGGGNLQSGQGRRQGRGVPGRVPDGNHRHGGSGETFRRFLRVRVQAMPEGGLRQGPSIRRGGGGDVALLLQRHEGVVGLLGGCVRLQGVDDPVHRPGAVQEGDDPDVELALQQIFSPGLGAVDRRFAGNDCIGNGFPDERKAGRRSLEYQPGRPEDHCPGEAVL